MKIEFSLTARAVIDTPDYDPLDMTIDPGDEPRRIMDAMAKDLPDCEVSWVWKGGYLEIIKNVVTPADRDDFDRRVAASAKRHWPKKKAA